MLYLIKRRIEKVMINDTFYITMSLKLKKSFRVSISVKFVMKESLKIKNNWKEKSPDN